MSKLRNFLLVCGIVLLALRMLPYRQEDPSKVQFNIHGIRVGMSKSEVSQRLGLPAEITPDGTTWMYYFGPLAAGQEFLEVDFEAQQRVSSVEGECLQIGSRVIASCGDSEIDLIKQIGVAGKRTFRGNCICSQYPGLTCRIEQDRIVGLQLQRTR